MSERQQEIETFGDSQVQALFDKFLATPEPVLNTGDLLIQRVLAEVQTVYGTGSQAQSPVTRMIQRVADWFAGFRPRAVVIAFSSVAVAALLVFAVAIYSSLPAAPVSISASVPSGEVLVLKPDSDSYRIYRAGESFALAEGDQIIARSGSVQLEPFPQQFADVMPGAQVELATVENEDGSRRVELFVIDGQVRHRGFEPLPTGDRYFISTASLRAEFDSNDFEIDAISPTRTIVTTRDGTAQIAGPSGTQELIAGQAAEVGERTLLIYNITPLQEGPGEIALAETPPARVEMPDDSHATVAPTDGELPAAPAATLTALPIPQPDSAPPVTGTSGGYITATGADAGSALTVSRVSIDETKAEPVLVLSGHGPTGASVQVLVEHQPVVTATVSTEGTWVASTPVNTIGRFEVGVVAINNAGEVVASASAAQMEIGPPVRTPVPTPAEQSGIMVPPSGATTTWTPGGGSGAYATATKPPTRRPTATPSPTATVAPIIFVAPVLPPTPRPAPTATATGEKSTPPPQDGPPFLVLLPSPTPSDTPTSSATPKATATNSATPLPTSTALPTATSTKLPLATSTGTATALPTATATNTAIPMPSSTSTATATPTKTQAPVATATASATQIAPTATATLPPIQPTADSTTNISLPPASDTPSPTAGVFPTPTPTTQPIAPTATATTRPPTATPTATSVPPLANAPGVNDSVPSDGTTTSGTLPSPSVTAPTATLTAAPPTATPVVVGPTATATQVAALPNSATGNTATSDAPPPTAVPPTAVPPTAVPPTAVPPTAVPPTAAPTIAAAPNTGVSQATGDTTTSDSVAPASDAASAVVSAPAPAATEASAASSAPTEATAAPTATTAAVEPAATPTN